MRRCHDSRCVAGFCSTHPSASARPNCRRNEHSQRSEPVSVLAQAWERTGIGMLVSVSYLGDSTQCLNCQGAGRFHPAPWNGAGLPAPFDKIVDGGTRAAWNWSILILRKSIPGHRASVAVVWLLSTMRFLHMTAPLSGMPWKNLACIKAHRLKFWCAV